MLTKSRATIVKVAKLVSCARAAVRLARRLTEARACLANDARVLPVKAVRLTPAPERALPELRLVTDAFNIAHPDRIRSLAEERSPLSFYGVDSKELLTDDVRVGDIPFIIANGSPLALVENLDAAFAFGTAADQAKRAVGRRRGRRGRRR